MTLDKSAVVWFLLIQKQRLLNSLPMVNSVTQLPFEMAVPAEVSKHAGLARQINKRLVPEEQAARLMKTKEQ